MSDINIAQRSLGNNGITIPSLGVGTNKWGDASPDALAQTFERGVESGVAMYDTTEVYGFGKSETQVGAALRKSGKSVTLITKFAPYPTRLSSTSLLRALDASLAR